jgi:hypothetical protein
VPPADVDAEGERRLELVPEADIEGLREDDEEEVALLEKHDDMDPLEDDDEVAEPETLGVAELVDEADFVPLFVLVRVNVVEREAVPVEEGVGERELRDVAVRVAVCEAERVPRDDSECELDAVKVELALQLGLPDSEGDDEEDGLAVSHNELPPVAVA